MLISQDRPGIIISWKYCTILNLQEIYLCNQVGIHRNNLQSHHDRCRRSCKAETRSRQRSFGSDCQWSPSNTHTWRNLCDQDMYRRLSMAPLNTRQCQFRIVFPWSLNTQRINNFDMQSLHARSGGKIWIKVQQTWHANASEGSWVVQAASFILTRMGFALVDVCLASWSGEALTTVAGERSRDVHADTVMFTGWTWEKFKIK